MKKAKYPDNKGDFESKDGELSLSSMAFIQSEVNFLAFPFFALHTKGLRKKTKTEYRDVIRRGSERVEIFWKVASNPEYGGYPGPFDKKVYRAIEQIINDMGFPVANPIPFTFSQLCRIIKIQNSGRAKRNIKASLIRIIATTIESKGAFYQKDKRKYLSHKAFHLYEQVFFKDDEMPDGAIADVNYLYLGEFYMRSLNSMYTKPINFTYYQSLRSNIARRLYLLFQVKFYTLKITKKAYISFEYKKLCDLLPITRQGYYSDAKRCLQPAHEELVETNLLKRVEWIKAGESCDWEIRYYPLKETLRNMSVINKHTKLLTHLTQMS